MSEDETTQAVLDVVDCIDDPQSLVRIAQACASRARTISLTRLKPKMLVKFTTSQDDVLVGRIDRITPYGVKIMVISAVTNRSTEYSVSPQFVTPITAVKGV